MGKTENEKGKKRLNRNISLYIFTTEKFGSQKENNVGRGDIEAAYMEIVKNYIEYYHVRARKCKFEYQFLSVTKYIALALIPIVQAIGMLQKFPWMATFLTSLCMLIESVLLMRKTKEKWIHYRAMANEVMGEQRKYRALEGRNSGIKFEEFVNRMENLVSEEAKKWCETVKKQEDKNNT